MINRLLNALGFADWYTVNRLLRTEGDKNYWVRLAVFGKLDDADDYRRMKERKTKIRHVVCGRWCKP